MINSQDWFPEHWHDSGVVLTLKNQVKDLFREYSISGSFLLEKIKLLDYYTLILVSFPAGRCVHEVADSRNIKDTDMMLIFFANIHSLNDEGVC